jgi:hypothetical protein
MPTGVLRPGMIVRHAMYDDDFPQDSLLGGPAKPWRENPLTVKKMKLNFLRRYLPGIKTFYFFKRRALYGDKNPSAT